LDAFIGSVTRGLNVLQLPTRQLAFVLYRGKCPRADERGKSTQ
jgi:hypothetical protein